MRHPSHTYFKICNGARMSLFAQASTGQSVSFCMYVVSFCMYVCQFMLQISCISDFNMYIGLCFRTQIRTPASAQEHKIAKIGSVRTCHVIYMCFQISRAWHDFIMRFSRKVVFFTIKHFIGACMVFRKQLCFINALHVVFKPPV